jgi:thiol-disulfide isomerase/thioredoxin
MPGVITEKGFKQISKNKFMKRFLCLLLSFLFIATTYAQSIKKMSITELQSYIDQSDHPLIVNFWATYCGPCIKEIPYFQSQTEKFKDSHIEMLLVSLDLPNYYPSKISAFAKANNLTARIIWLNETNADYFCPMIDKKWSGGIPSTLFINNKTHYRKFFERQLTEGQVVENIQTLVKE